MQRNLRLRAAVTSAARNSLETLGFVDVETPLLLKVHLREHVNSSFQHVHRNVFGHCHNPQNNINNLNGSRFRSILSTARCFRDESGRADRQPEFTQLDIEMSFIDSNDIMLVVESVVENMINASKEILITHGNNNNTVKKMIIIILILTNLKFQKLHMKKLMINQIYQDIHG